MAYRHQLLSPADPRVLRQGCHTTFNACVARLRTHSVSAKPLTFQLEHDRPRAHRANWELDT